LIIWSALVAAVLAFQAAPPVAVAPLQESPAMAAAKANMARIKVRPVFKSGPDAAFPDAARLAGEFGKVEISGILGVDGRITEAKVSVSSRSSLLDASALAAATGSLFEPARDAQGEALSIPISVPLDFSNARTPGKGGGVLRYHCDQFVRDYDWWHAHWPAKAHDELYRMIAGFSLLMRIRGNNGSLDPSVLPKNDVFEDRWNAAIAACRKTPGGLFVDVFKPEGDELRRLAGG
jgi:TonB family protein